MFIVQFHHYEVLFLELLHYFQNYRFFVFFSFRSDLEKAMQSLRISYRTLFVHRQPFPSVSVLNSLIHFLSFKS